jgi:hypothetical protein
MESRRNFPSLVKMKFVIFFMSSKIRPYLLACGLWLLVFTLSAQPKTDCVCNGSSAGGGKFYIGAGGDFHLANFENDDRKYAVSTLGFGFHSGYNFNKNFSIQTGIQKYGFSNLKEGDASKSGKYSYIDIPLLGVYRFIKRGSRFIPYLQGGYVLNATLAKNFEGNTNQTGFQLNAHYAHLGGGILFVLANKFTLYAEPGLNINPNLFKGTYVWDIFKLKTGLSVGVNYHF